MKHMRQREAERGFALIIVVMIVAAISIVAVTLLNFVNLDIVIAGQNRRTFESKAVADGALMELVDHREMFPVDRDDAGVVLGGMLPDFNTADLRYVLSDPYNALGGQCWDPLSPAICRPPGNSFFDESGGSEERPPMDYTADVRLLRYVPISESSLNWTRALFWEIRSIGEVGRGESTTEIRAEAWRVVSYSPQTLLPRLHGR